MLVLLDVETYELDYCLSEPSVLDSPDGELFGMSLHWLITEAYEFIESFKKKKIEELSPHRKYDHNVELEDGAHTSLEYYPLYAISL